MDGQASAEFPRDANARIFRRFGWDLTALRRWPPNGGAHTAWWLFSTRPERDWTGDGWSDDWSPDREITLQ